MYKITVFLCAMTLAFVVGSQAFCATNKPVIALFGNTSEGVFVTDATPEAKADAIVAMGFNMVVLSHVTEAANPIVHALKVKGVEVFGELSQFGGHMFDNDMPVLADGTTVLPAGFPTCAGGLNALPSNKEYYNYCMDQIKLMVDTVPELDGVATDFCRWPINWHVLAWESGKWSPSDFDSSFDPITMAQFEADSGVNIPDNLSTAAEWSAWIHTNANDEWGKWKTSFITKFHKEASEYIKLKLGADKQLAACTVPWTATQYDGAMLKIVGQDYAAMAPYVETWFPMSYHQMMGYPVSWIGEFATYTKQITNQRTVPFMMAMSIMNAFCGEELLLSPQELKESILTAVNAPGSDGVIVFEYGLALSYERFDEVLATIAEIKTATSVEEEEESISQFPLLNQNSPNPFNPSTTISFSIPKDGLVTVEIFNSVGQKVSTLVSKFMREGRHSLVWDASNFSSGLYYYTMKSGGFSKTMPMTLLK